MIVYISASASKRKFANVNEISNNAKRSGYQGCVTQKLTQHLQTVIEKLRRPPRQHPQLVADLGDLYAESGQTLQGSFSAVSKPNFASKYSLESS